MMRLAINQPFDLALSLEMGQAFRWRRVGDALVAHWDWGRPPAHWDWGRPPAHWRTGVGGWYSGVIGPRFLAPATRRPIRRPHNPPRPYPTLRQTARVQQPPRRRKPRRPNVPPVLPQQVKQGQLMRRFPAIDQLNPRRDGPVPVADQMRRTLRPPAARPGQSLRPRNQKTPTPSPQQHCGLPSIQYARYGFASANRPVPAFRTAATAAPSKAPSATTCRRYS